MELRAAPGKHVFPAVPERSSVLYLAVATPETGCFLALRDARLTCSDLRGQWNPHRRLPREGGSVQRTIYPAEPRQRHLAIATSFLGDRRDRSLFVVTPSLDGADDVD
jgi:hypothetical protein